MSLASYRRRLRELTWKERALLGETTAALALASIAIRLLPFRKVVGALLPDEASGPAAQEDDFQAIAKTRWAIEACARILPWRIVCFQKGLAMYWLLHRRGINSQLHYGVAQDADRGLKAHVWLTYAGEGIIGEEEAPNFACVAIFPSRSTGQAAGAHAASMPHP